MPIDLTGRYAGVASRECIEALEARPALASALFHDGGRAAGLARFVGPITSVRLVELVGETSGAARLPSPAPSTEAQVEGT